MSNPGTRAKTHYDILGVKPTASPQQIRRAFRDRSKLYHPDTTELPANEATAKFQQLNEAYAVLSSPDRRWQYDQQVGYSRISVMQPMQSLAKESTAPRRKATINNMYLDPTDRPLSAGEIFALFILGLTFLACLVLVFTVALTRSEELVNLEDFPAPQSAELSVPFSSAPELPTASAPQLVDDSLLNQGSVAGQAPELPQQEGQPGSQDQALLSPQPTWL